MRYEEDRRRLDVLTDLFFHTVKPSELFQLTMTINAMCNLGDFIHSIRLMSAARTTVAPAGAGKLAWYPGQTWQASLTASAEAGKLAGYPRRGATAYAPRHPARDE